MPLYTHFIITIIYYQLYFVKFTPWKRQGEASSSIKFTTDFASHVLHSLLGTMSTVSVEVH